MKKLFFTLLFAAATLQGWADEYYLVGGCTDSGWSDGEYNRSAVRAYTADGTTWVWAGKLTTGEGDNGRFKIPNSTGGWDGFWAPSQGTVLTSTFSALSTNGSGDYKYCVSEEGYYLVTFTTGDTKQIKAEKLTAPSMDGDYYCISSVNDYYYFAAYIATDATKNAKARLTADLSFEGKTFVPMASDKHKFCGEFDGNGHTIDYAVVTGSYRFIGLFTYVTGKDGKTANIHDLIMGEHCSFTGSVKVGGIAGFARDGGEIKLTNIVNKANVTSTAGENLNEGNTAGFIACATDNTIITATNCANTGEVHGQDGQCAAFAGWTQSGTTFTNCWNIGDIYNMQDNQSLYRNAGSVTATNCYDANGADFYTQGTKIPRTTVASGELCFKLNGDQSNIAWYQTLGEGNDAHPVPFSSHAQVYANGNLKCDGTSAGGDLTYSNSSGSEIPPHDFSNGWCTVCGALDHDYLTADMAGYYSIGSANDLKWFAAIVENVNQSANAKLTSDIATYSGPYIGNSEATSFSGIFDGQGHKITVNFVTEESKIGLFRCVKNGTIQNLIVDGTISAGNNNLMGGLVNESRQNSVYRNIVVAVNMTSTHSGDGTHGGVISVAWGTPTIENVAFVGSINASNNYGSCGIIGYAHSGGTIHYTNCYVSGTLTLTGNNNRVFGRNGEYCDNCYTTLNMTKLNDADRFTGSDVTSEKVASGELCYLLNGSSCYGAKWFQNLSGTTDSYPVPFNTHGIVNKISSAGYTTQYIASTDVTIPTGVKAYAGETSGTKLSLKELTDAISKEDAVILQGTEGFYSFVPTTGASKYTGNALQGSDGTIQGSGNNIYALSVKNEKVGFYPVGTSENPVTIPAGKAYLEYTSTGGNAVKGFTFVFDEDDATGISLMEDGRSQMEDGAIYNLAGQRINKMQRGINIVNGKKILK